MAVAVVLRMALWGLRLWVQPLDWDYFLGISDAGSFIKVAKCIAGLATSDSLTFYDTRVMAGWPMLLSVGLRLFSTPLWLVGCTLAMSGAAVWLFHRLSRNDTLTLLFAVSPPVWLLVGVQGMAEPAFLAAGLGALLCARDKQWFACGLLGGLMCSLKPHGIFLAGGLALASVIAPGNGGWRKLGLLTLGGVLFPCIIAVINLHLYGDALKPFHTYGANLVLLNIPAESAAKLGDASGAWAMPFVTLVVTPLRLAVPAWKIAYIYVHVLVLLFLMARTAMAWATENARASTVVMALRCWLLGAGGAILCVGPYWGFYTFDRYFIWLLPAALILNADLVPPRRWVPWSAALASFALAAYVFAFRH